MARPRYPQLPVSTTTHSEQVTKDLFLCTKIDMIEEDVSENHYDITYHVEVIFICAIKIVYWILFRKPHFVLSSEYFLL